MNLPWKRRRRGNDLIRSPHELRRDLWVSWRPNGIGEQKPHHYGAIAHTIWDNRRELPYALRILRKGVCDGCALGVAGFHDWTISGVHLCTTRLDLLKVNTAHAIDERHFADAGALARMKGRELRELGRLAHPMVRRRGELGFTRVSWDEALDLVAGRIRSTTPDRVGLYMTARGITNEVYYDVPEGSPLHWHEQRRQRGTRLSCAVDVGAQGIDRRRRDDVLVPRRDRE